MLEFVVSPPKIFSEKNIENILDPFAIKSSFKYEDNSPIDFALVSGEYNIEVV